MEEFKREKKRKHEGKQEKKKLEKSGVLTKYTFLYYKRRTSTGLYQTMTKRRIHSVYVPSSFPSSSSSSSSSSSFCLLLRIFLLQLKQKKKLVLYLERMQEQQQLREVMTMKQLSRSFHRAEIAYRRAALVRPVLLPLTL